MNWSWKQVALITGSFALLWLCMTAIGMLPLDALKGLVEQSMGSPRAWSGTFREMMPLLLAGLAVFLGLKAGLFNIGAEGQIVMGGLAAAIVALTVKGIPGGLLAVLAGAAAGAIWSLPAGLLKALRGGHEVISTIMLNNIGALLALWIVKGILKDKSQQSATTASLDPMTTLPDLVHVGSFRLNWAVVFAVVLVAALAVWLKRFVAGYELRAVGAAPKAAEFAGVETKRVQIWAMAASGAISGLTGALLLLGYEHRFYSDFAAGYGFDALGVALLAGGSALALLPSAFLFAVISKGTTGLSLVGVPKGMSGVLLGIIIIVFAAFRYRQVKSNEH